MAKPRKVVRSKYMYKRKTHKVRNTLLFLLLVLLLVGLGYILSREWSLRFGPGAQNTSSDPASSLPPVSEPASSEPVSSEPAVQAALNGYLLPQEDARKTGDSLKAALQAVKDAGYNAVVVELKTEEGVVTFDSGNALAQEWRAIAETPIALDAFVETARSLELTPVACISALKDPTAHVRRGNSFGYGGDAGVNWLDGRADQGGKSWLNPYMENTRSYLSGLCGEAAARGFETILLTNVNFPTTPHQEKMGLLNETTTREGILNQLLEECRTAAVGADVCNVYDMARYASENAQPAGTLPAPAIDLDAVASGRKSICENYGIAGEAELTPAEVVDGVLARTQPGGLAVVRAADLPQVQAVLEKNGITEWIVRS